MNQMRIISAKGGKSGKATKMKMNDKADEKIFF